MRPSLVSKTSGASIYRTIPLIVPPPSIGHVQGLPGVFGAEAGQAYGGAEQVWAPGGKVLPERLLSCGGKLVDPGG